MFFYVNKTVVGSGSKGAPKCVGEGVAYGLHFCWFFTYTCLLMHDMFDLVSCWCEVTVLCFTITSCSHVVTLHHGIMSVTSCGTCTKAYKRPCTPRHWGFTPGSSPNGWRGTRARIDWHAGAPTLLEPTSFKLNWLGCYQFSVSVRPRRHTNTLQELPGNAVFDLTSTSLQDCHAFQLVPVCTVYRVVKSTSAEVCCHRVRLSTPHCACHIYIRLK